MSLEFQALEYTITTGWGRSRAVKTVLEGVSGQACPGQLLAVMGPTGACCACWGGVAAAAAARAEGRRVGPMLLLRQRSTALVPEALLAPELCAGSGKTSLLNALAGRLPAGGKLEGEVHLQGVLGNLPCCAPPQNATTTCASAPLGWPCVPRTERCSVPAASKRCSAPAASTPQMLVNGQPRSASFRSITAFVMQARGVGISGFLSSLVLSGEGGGHGRMQHSSPPLPGMNPHPTPGAPSASPLPAG